MEPELRVDTRGVRGRDAQRPVICAQPLGHNTLAGPRSLWVQTHGRQAWKTRGRHQIGARKDSQEPKEKPFIRGSREAGGKPDLREGASG